jgi:cysteine desulfuration protein SufE
MPAPFDNLIDDFAALDDWEDRYRYVIDLGRALAPLAPEERVDINKVRGCASQVWLVTEQHPEEGETRLTFRGDSDAHIVKGLIAILIALYSGQSGSKILATDEKAALAKLGLMDHLTAQRSNGVASMVARIKADAAKALDSHG